MKYNQNESYLSTYQLVVVILMYFIHHSHVYKRQYDVLIHHSHVYKRQYDVFFRHSHASIYHSDVLLRHSHASKKESV